MKWPAPAWLNPRNWFRRDITIEQLVSLGLGSPQAAGITLTTDVALGVSAVFCACRVISEDLASLPMLVYAGDRLDDGATPLRDDPVTRLLARPNPEQTGPVAWAAWQFNALLHGYGLMEVVRDGAGRPAQLWPIPTAHVRPDRAGGELVFEVTTDGQGVTLRRDEVLFLPGVSPDGSVGYDLVRTAREVLGAAAARQRFTAARFKNGMAPAGVIKHPGTLSDDARENMRKSWARSYGGPNNAGVPMILEEGVGWDPLEIAHNDQLQLAQLGEFHVDEVARFFNISPVKLHKLGRATWANLETLNRDHVITTLGPWIAKRDAEIDRGLLEPGRHCRHVVDRLLTADTATRFAAWSGALQAGWMTINEVRAREDLPPRPGGDELRVPLNQAPAAAGTSDQSPVASEQSDTQTEEPADGTDPPQPAQ